MIHQDNFSCTQASLIPIRIRVLYANLHWRKQRLSGVLEEETVAGGLIGQQKLCKSIRKQLISRGFSLHGSGDGC